MNKPGYVLVSANTLTKKQIREARKLGWISQALLNSAIPNKRNFYAGEMGSSAAREEIAKIINTRRTSEPSELSEPSEPPTLLAAVQEMTQRDVANCILAGLRGERYQDGCALAWKVHDQTIGWKQMTAEETDVLAMKIAAMILGMAK